MTLKSSGMIMFMRLAWIHLAALHRRDVDLHGLGLVHGAQLRRRCRGPGRRTGMPVFWVNGSPNAAMADFFHTPPNTKAVTGGSAALARRVSVAEAARAARDPAKPGPARRGIARRSSPRVSSSTSRRRAQMSSIDRSSLVVAIDRLMLLSLMRVRRLASDCVAAALAKVNIASPIRMAEAAAMVGSEVACTPDQILTATGLPTPPSTNVATSNSCAECTNAKMRADDDAGRDDRQRDAQDRPQRMRAVDDGGALEVDVGAAQARGGVDDDERHAAHRMRAGETDDGVDQAERHEEQVGRQRRDDRRRHQRAQDERAEQRFCRNDVAGQREGGGHAEQRRDRGGERCRP